MVIFKVAVPINVSHWNNTATLLVKTVLQPSFHPVLRQERRLVPREVINLDLHGNVFTLVLLLIEYLAVLRLLFCFNLSELKLMILYNLSLLLSPLQQISLFQLLLPPLDIVRLDLLVKCTMIVRL